MATQHANERKQLSRTDALRASLERWLRDADAAGLNDDEVTALIAVARNDMRKEKV